MNGALRVASAFPIGNAERDDARKIIPRRNARWQRWSVVVVYALAMAWVEAAVVFYLRSQMNRLVPYQPEPLPVTGGFAFAEIIREGATLVMLATVGYLAGQTWRSRIAYSLTAFGVWDIGYYVWLVPLTGWPHSVFQWDILFLIPLPWWGPVWSPASIAVVMIVFGTVIATHDSDEHPIWPTSLSLAAAGLGTGLALYTFTADSWRLVIAEESLEPLRSMLPQWFNWPLFAVALALLLMPVISVWQQARGLASHVPSVET